MNQSELKEKACHINKALGDSGLVTLTFGNASAADRELGVMAIKPSGVSYDELTPEHIVLLSLEDGSIIEGDLAPSSDMPTHLVLYQQFQSIGGIVHTHSCHATAWAQARREIPCLGTTHADHFNGSVPVTRFLTEREVLEEYEHNTGLLIVERFMAENLNPLDFPAVLVAGHGPFAWGGSAEESLENAIALEMIAQTAWVSCQLNPEPQQLPDFLLKKHFERKHGKTAYYGQPTRHH